MEEESGSGTNEIDLLIGLSGSLGSHVEDFLMSLFPIPQETTSEEARGEL